MSTGFVDNIEQKTLSSSVFRQVVFTGSHLQLVVMSLAPLEEIGEEVHDDTDQFFRVESGEGKVIMNGQESEVRDGTAIVVPAGTKHNIINTSKTHPLKLYTIYAPPHHRDGRLHKTKEDAEKDTTDFI